MLGESADRGLRQRDGRLPRARRAARRRASAPANLSRRRGCGMRPSICIPARCWASSPSRARARTSSSTSCPGRAAERRRHSWSTARPSRSAIRPTPSGPASSTSPPTARRLCSCSARCARTSRCRSRRASGNWGWINLGRERQTVDEGGRDAPDRRPRRQRGPPPIRRQPAEGDDRALGGRRRQDDAVLRPDARHRHPHQEPDLRPAARPRRRRSGGPAVHVRAQGDPARLRPRRWSSSAARSSPRCPPPTPTRPRCCARRTT